jgi:nicotinamide mononucleotide transporter
MYLALQNSGSTLLMLDAITAAAGLLATWMQARKFIENWLIWIPTDIALTIMFFIEHLYVTAGLFLLYTIIAIFAYIKWNKELIRSKQ